ncbi:inositol monophosphatase family protein [Cellulomonas sp. URHD0024]|uniref:inositol monophosphatase family protein n=1 Tax=Cellulomonas sp. URHD0024 TaxID=1302620 RepID=UPI0003F71EB3|nr:inositol monophosphatase family protein [Cellulomonas sp. URHD0024]
MLTDPADAALAVHLATRGMDVVLSHLADSAPKYAKAGHDFATAADLAAETAIREALLLARPDDAMIGEELGAFGGSTDRTWLVDPLCGTRNFASGTHVFCVNVALRERGSVRVAAVAEPAARRVVWTDGFGGHERPADGADRRVAPASDSRIVELNADGPGDRTGPLLVADADFRAWMTPRVSASTVALAWVATGQRAAYVSDGNLLDSVHFAAGIALCVGAGCVVTDLDGQSFTTGAGLAISADARTHESLVAHIARVRSGLSPS